MKESEVAKGDVSKFNVSVKASEVVLTPVKKENSTMERMEEFPVQTRRVRQSSLRWHSTGTCSTQIDVRGQSGETRPRFSTLGPSILRYRSSVGCLN